MPSALAAIDLITALVAYVVGNAVTSTVGAVGTAMWRVAAGTAPRVRESSGRLRRAAA